MSKQDHEDLKSLDFCMHCKKSVRHACGSGLQAGGCINFPAWRASQQIEEIRKLEAQSGLKADWGSLPEMQKQEKRCDYCGDQTKWCNSGREWYACTKPGAQPTTDAINQPAHYSRWKMQPIEFIAANDLPFWLANLIKYAMRYDAKDGLQDLYKARSYLDMQIRKVEGLSRFWEKPVAEQQSSAQLQKTVSDRQSQLQKAAVYEQADELKRRAAEAKYQIELNHANQQVNGW